MNGYKTSSKRQDCKKMQACAVITFIRVFLPFINVQIGAFLYGQGRIDTSGKDCSGLKADLPT